MTEEKSESKVSEPSIEEVEMEPDRDRGHVGLPPGPVRPSIRGNAKGRWTTKKGDK